MEAQFERAHLYYMPSRGSGVYLRDGNDKESVSLSLPPGGRDPKLVMLDEAGKQIAEVPPQK